MSPRVAMHVLISLALVPIAAPSVRRPTLWVAWCVFSGAPKETIEAAIDRVADAVNAL